MLHEAGIYLDGFAVNIVMHLRIHLAYHNPKKMLAAVDRVLETIRPVVRRSIELERGERPRRFSSGVALRSA